MKRRRKIPAAKPCGCVFGSCLKCARPGNRLIVPPETVAAMWADYSAGMSLSAVERKYARTPKSLRPIFARRGYTVRPTPFGHAARDPQTGRVLPFKPATPAQITAAIRPLTRIKVPRSLSLEWRRRPMSWRRQLIRRIRAHVRPPHPRPATPFSRNVQPFEYGTPAVMRLQDRLNRGRDTRHRACQIRPCSEGVIYRGRLYFWTGRTEKNFAAGSGYISSGKREKKERLHHVIYREHHGAIPPAHTVIFRDGNKNNFAPRNLALRSMADCARMNQWKNLPVAAQKNVIEKMQRQRALTMARKARRQTAALLAAADFTTALQR